MSGNRRLHSRRRSEIAGHGGPRVAVAGTPVNRVQRLAQPGPWPFGTLISLLKTAEQMEPEDVESVPGAKDRCQPWLPRRNAVGALAGATSAPSPSPRTFLGHETEAVLATARFAGSCRPHADRCSTATAALLHSRRNHRLPRGLRRVPKIVLFFDAVLLLYFFSGVTNVDWTRPLTANLLFALMLAGAVTAISYGFFTLAGEMLNNHKADDATVGLDDVDPVTTAALALAGLGVAVLALLMFVRMREEVLQALGPDHDGAALVIALTLAVVSVLANTMVIAVHALDGSPDTARLDSLGEAVRRPLTRQHQMLEQAASLDPQIQAVDRRAQRDAAAGSPPPAARLPRPTSSWTPPGPCTRASGCSANPPPTPTPPGSSATVPAPDTPRSTSAPCTWPWSSCPHPPRGRTPRPPLRRIPTPPTTTARTTATATATRPNPNQHHQPRPRSTPSGGATPWATARLAQRLRHRTAPAVVLLAPRTVSITHDNLRLSCTN